MLEDGNQAKTEVEIDDSDSDSELENGDLEDREDLYAMGHLDGYTRASLKSYVLFPVIGFYRPERMNQKLFLRPGFFYNPEGFITKHGFICQITR